MATSGVKVSNKARGIDKRPSEPVCPSDILADAQLQMCDLLARGAWFQTLLYIWRDKTDRVSGSIEAWARIWGCSVEQAEHCIEQFRLYQPCNVTECHGTVTLINRRSTRKLRVRKNARERKAKQRGADIVDTYCHADVTPEKHLPSSSSSLSGDCKQSPPPTPPRPLPADIYDKYPGLRILHDCNLLRSLTLEQYEEIVRTKHPLLNRPAAARKAVSRALIDGHVHSVGGLVDWQFRDHQTATAATIERRAKAIADRDTDIAAAVEVISHLRQTDAPDLPGRSEVIERDIFGQYGRSAVTLLRAKLADGEAPDKTGALAPP